MSNFVLYGGDVYSSVDPFATAVAVNDAQVVWVGSDEAAQARPEPAEDLAEDFITPGFVHAGLDARTGNVDIHALLSAGVTSVHAYGPAQTLAWLAREALADVVCYATDAGSGRRALPAGQVCELPVGELPQDPVFMLIDTPAELDQLIRALADRTFVTHAQRFGWRAAINVDSDAPQVVSALAGSGIPITVDPVARRHALAELLSQGAQLSFALAAQPWETVQAAVFGESGISARAAFNCATRFGHRAAGRSDLGTIAPGSQASFARWRVSELVVQVADERVAAWSTDPRSGTPGLPNLEPGRELPEPVVVWVGGDVVFDQRAS